MTLPQILRVLWARRFAVLTSAALLLGLAVLISVLLPKTYKANADILINLNSQDELSNNNSPAHEAVAREVATQSDVISSQRVAKTVVKLLKLDQDPEQIADWRSDTTGDGNIDNWISTKLLEDLSVKADSDGSVIRVSYKAPSAQQAADVANAFVQAYLTIALELKSDPARRSADFFSQRVEDARTTLEQAKARLSAYQIANKVVNPSEKYDAENERLASLNKELGELQSAMAEVEARKRSGANSASLPEVLNDPVVQSLKQSLAEAEAEMQQFQRRYGSNHPTMVASQRQVASLRAQLRQETSRRAKSIGVAGDITSRKTKEIAKALEAQREKVLSLKVHRDKMSVMRQEVDAAEEAFKLVNERSSNSSIRSESGQLNASLLTPAVPPDKADSPKIVLNSAIGTLLGALIGSFLALGREASRPQIRSVQDLMDAFDLPVLVSLPNGDGGSKGGNDGGGGRALPRLSHLGSAAPRLENARS